MMRWGKTAGIGVLIGLPLWLAGSAACNAAELTRDQAREIIDARLAAKGVVTRDIPIGAGLNIAMVKPMDFSAPIRVDMLRVYQELQRQGLVSMVDRGGLQGFGGKVETFDVQLTPEGEKVLGPLQKGRPDYVTGMSVYPIPQSYVRIVTCKKRVHEVTGIRILKPDVEVEAEFSWDCGEASPLRDLIESARKEYPRDPGPAPTEGTDAVKLALYDDGWRVADEK